jgi:hypothetical protein
VTESLLSAPSTNATLILTPSTGSVLCQPAPAPLPVTAN